MLLSRQRQRPDTTMNKRSAVSPLAEEDVAGLRVPVGGLLFDPRHVVVVADSGFLDPLGQQQHFAQ